MGWRRSRLRPSLGTRRSDIPRRRPPGNKVDRSRARHSSWIEPPRGHATNVRDHTPRRSSAGRPPSRHTTRPVLLHRRRLLGSRWHGVQGSGATESVCACVVAAQSREGARRCSSLARAQPRVESREAQAVSTRCLLTKSREDQRAARRLPREASGGQALEGAGLPRTKDCGRGVFTGAEWCQLLARCGHVTGESTR
jgi:hypothetical protein